ncbi:MAG: ABC-type transport auxiliary lipoprotein family protein [Gammaproteobacteria bacterium]|nr:ABC-type transport auxiliary lipoprotein family protein [Gammaproteobacteria bacterium]
MKFILLMSVLFLAGCGSVATPDSHYYRLEELINPQSQSTLLQSDVSVSLFKLSGMLNNRNLLFTTEDRPNEVVPLHYHLWHDALGNILTRQFIDYLKLSAGKHQVSAYRYTSVDGLHVVVTLERMEIRYADDSRLHVKLNARIINSKGSVLLDKDYENSEVSESSDIYQLVSRYNAVLRKTYHQLLEDLVTL